MKPDPVKRAFAQELLKVSPEFNHSVDMLWLIFNFGGIAPAKLIVSHFDRDFDKMIKLLTESGVVKWKSGGQLLRGKDLEGLILVLDEKIEHSLQKREFEKLTFGEFRQLIAALYGETLVQNINSDIIDSLSLMLERIIEEASPMTPILLLRVLRAHEEVGINPLANSKLFLDSYLSAYLDLTKSDGMGINLSDRGQEVLKKDEYLWDIYTKKNQQQPMTPQTQIL